MTRMTLRPMGLWALTFVLCGSLSAQGGNADARTNTKPPQTNPDQPFRPAPNARAFQPIQPPQDPDRVRGTYEIGGTPRTITEGQFYETYQLLKPHEEKPNRPLQAQRILEHILLLAEAESLGFELTGEEKDLVNPLKNNPQFETMLRERNKSMGITEEQFVRYIAESRAIARLKNWYASSARVRSSQVYDLWKKDNFLYRVAYLDFSAEDQLPELQKATPTEEQLKNFWNTNPKVQNEHRTPTSVTADILVFDPSSVDESELQKLRAAHKIDLEAALSHFAKNRARLLEQIPSERRHELYPPKGEKRPVKDLVTPFQLLRDQIEREILVGDRLTKAFAAAEEATSSADLAAIAEKHGLAHVRLDSANRQKVASEYAHLGSTLFRDLFNAGPGTYSQEIQFFGPLQFFWRLENKAVSSLPPFNDVKGNIVDNWYAHEAYTRAQAEAKALLDAVDNAVKEKTQERERKMDEAAVAAAETEIKASNVTADRQKATIRQKHKSLGEYEKRKLRAQHMPEYFDQIVADRKLTMKELSSFSFNFARGDRSNIKDRKERAETFLQTSYQVKALGEGLLSPVLSDVISQAHYIAKVLGKEEPAFEKMSAVDYHQRKMASERQAMFTSNYRWTLIQVQRRLNWKDR